jgi:hypothetical protein
VTRQRRRPRVGDECWEVEWCAGVPLDENGDADLDRADYRVCRFADRDAALAFAREIFPKDHFGAVRITPERFEPYDELEAVAYPHAGYWQAIGDSEFYEGE